MHIVGLGMNEICENTHHDTSRMHPKEEELA